MAFKWLAHQLTDSTQSFSVSADLLDMKLESLNWIQPRFRAGEYAERRKYRCVRCGKQWSSSATWLSPLLECSDCQHPKEPLPGVQTRREWVA